MKLKPGKYYKTREGKKAYVAAVGAPFKCVSDYNGAIGWVDNNLPNTDGMGWDADTGRYRRIGETEYDLIAEWANPKRIKGWLCIWDAAGAVSIFHSDERQAREATMGSARKIAIKEIDVLEGEGLET